MKPLYDGKENCCGCCACESVCPGGAITMTADGEGFLYPAVDERLCADCGLCVKVCPIKAAGNMKENGQPRFYAARHRSEEVLVSSTSGGAFTALSDYVLDCGGAVCGVDFGEDFHVLHRIAETKTERDRMRVSKYVQSDLRGFFPKAAELMEKGLVLFTGTPCQCAGLRSYMAGSPKLENLIVCDLICYGIPSPLLWSEYLRLLEAESGKRICEVKFRSKDRGWSRGESGRIFLYRLEGESSFREDGRFYDLFFNRRTIMRPSCAACRFTDLHRPSDITAADCWGIEKYAPALYDRLGVSLVMVNSERGASIFEKMRGDMIVAERPVDEILKEQPRLSRPVQYDGRREEFWRTMKSLGLAAAMKGNSFQR